MGQALTNTYIRVQMLFRLLKTSLWRRPRATLLVLASVVLGSAIATAFLGVYGDLSRRLALELRNYGANIIVEPKSGGMSAPLREEDLPRLKTVFWKHNIVGFAPYLFGIASLASESHREEGVVTGTWFARPLAVEGEETTLQGVKIIAPWWSVEGEWPAEPGEAVVGARLAGRLALRVGSTVTGKSASRVTVFRVSGIVTTGGYEEDLLFAPLQTVQQLLGRPGEISRVLVSALTVPLDDFGRRDPTTMSKLDYERWYCTAYVTAVAKNIEEAMSDSRAKPIWRVAGAEGDLLRKLDKLLILLTVLAMAAAATAVATGLMASLAERSREIALMKTIGADHRQVARLLLAEVLLISLAGGLIGYGLGGRLALLITRTVFNGVPVTPAWLLPTALISAAAVALAGGIVPLRAALKSEPVPVLKG